MTDFYDDYIDSYGDSAPPPVPTNTNNTNAGPPDRIAAWARSNANPNYPPARSGSRSAPTSSYAPSSFGGGGGGPKRRPTRRGTSRAGSRIQSTYEEEEEGYVSGEYDDGPFELIKIRIKACHFSAFNYSAL